MRESIFTLYNVKRRSVYKIRTVFLQYILPGPLLEKYEGPLFHLMKWNTAMKRDGGLK